MVQCQNLAGAIPEVSAVPVFAAKAASGEKMCLSQNSNHIGQHGHRKHCDWPACLWRLSELG